MANAVWNLYASDLKPSNWRVRQARPQLRFYISLPVQPPRYQPASAPPPRIDLRLVHDSNAFIVDKIVLPIEPFTQQNDARQRRCYYIIGWPDLPAARPVVDAAMVLDYISPRTLEDWEYQDVLYREQERLRAREVEEPLMAKGTTFAAAHRRPGAAMPKSGRPSSRTMMMGQPPAELEINSERDEKLQRRKSCPSLSTPQRRRLAQLVAEEEMLGQIQEEDPALAISKHMHGDKSVDEDSTVSNDNSENANGVDWDKETSEAVDLLHLNAVASGSSVGTPGPAGPKPITNAAAFMTLLPGSTSTRAAAAAAAAAVPNCQHSSPHGFNHPAVRANNQRPSHYSPGHSFRDRTPVSTTAIPRPSSVSRRQKCQSTTVKPESDFTPVGRTSPRQLKRLAGDAPDVESTGGVTRSSTRSSKKRKSKGAGLLQSCTKSEEAVNTGSGPPLDLVQGEQDYVVKRLEGDHVLDGVHWFQVRWEGTWPEDQNPTWEPEANISAKLVRDYLNNKAKRKSARSRKTGDKKKGDHGRSKPKRQGTLADWAKGYVSVSEAFENKAELEAASTKAFLGPGNPPADGEDADDSQDELLVVGGEFDRAAEEPTKADAGLGLAAQFGSLVTSGRWRF